MRVLLLEELSVLRGPFRNFELLSSLVELGTENTIIMITEESEMVPLNTSAAVPVTKKTTNMDKNTISNINGSLMGEWGDKNRRIGATFVGAILLLFLVVDHSWFGNRETAVESTNLPSSPAKNETADLFPQEAKNRTEATYNISESKLPALNSLLAPHRHGYEDADRIAGDVQWLLDYAVVGFGKCGTTTLIRWLQSRNEYIYTLKNKGTYVIAPPREIEFLNQGLPTKMVTQLYTFAQQEEYDHQRGRLQPGEKLFKGYKNPKDIRLSTARKMLSRFWPKTPLIVTVRHPVHWMVSLYNFHMIEQRAIQPPTIDSMLGRRGAEDGSTPGHFVSTQKGVFHSMLAELGKTNMAEDSPEWELLQPWLNASSDRIMKENPFPNPVFLIELMQMHDSNMTRSQRFTNDLETHLGFPHNLLPPSPPVIRPGHTPPPNNTENLFGPPKDRHLLQDLNHGKVPKQNKKRAPLSKAEEERVKIDICDAQYAPVLEELMNIARAASKWFRLYFIKSPGVKVSDPEHLANLFLDWEVNPCDDPAQRRYMLEEL